MEIVITTKQGPFTRILRKLTIIFFGIFLTSFIFALSTKFTGEYGIWLGLLICGLLIFGGFYYIGKESRIRTIVWTMLITIIVFTALFIAGISFVTANLNFTQP